MADVPSPVLRDIRPFAGSNRLAAGRATYNCLRVRLAHRRGSCLSLSYRHFFDAASSSLSSCAGTARISGTRVQATRTEAWHSDVSRQSECGTKPDEKLSAVTHRNVLGEFRKPKSTAPARGRRRVVCRRQRMR